MTCLGVRARSRDVVGVLERGEVRAGLGAGFGVRLVFSFSASAG
jgi:hypothetical protein